MERYLTTRLIAGQMGGTLFSKKDWIGRLLDGYLVKQQHEE